MVALIGQISVEKTMLRVAVVGAGGTARYVRRGYGRIPGVEWSLAVDTNPEVLKICAGEGAKRGSTRFEDALGADIDLVDVSTPNHLHEEHACAALNAGKHVLLQKPMAHNVASADRILEAAARSKGTLGMYMVLLTNPISWEIRELIQSGVLGEIQSVRARDAHRGGLRMPARTEHWRGSVEKTGGGSFVQLSVHSMNLIQWWLGRRITEATAFSANQHCGTNVGGDDVTVACVKFGAEDKAPLGTFDSGYASEGRAREVYGTKGFVRYMNESEVELMLDVPYESETMKYTRVGEVQRFPTVAPAADDVSNPVNQVRMFVEAVMSGTKPVMSGEAGRHDLAVCAVIYESARRGAAMRVDSKGRD
jgi:predicted dehydrogenase